MQMAFEAAFNSTIAAHSFVKGPRPILDSSDGVSAVVDGLMAYPYKTTEA
jgi:hypothetical protein